MSEMNYFVMLMLRFKNIGTLPMFLDKGEKFVYPNSHAKNRQTMRRGLPSSYSNIAQRGNNKET